MIPPDTPQSLQKLEFSQTPNQDGITHLTHLIEETMPSNSQNNVNYDNNEPESERQNPELEFTKVFGQGKRPRQANKSRSTIPGLTHENFEQLLKIVYDKIKSTQFTIFIWKKSKSTKKQPKNSRQIKKCTNG